MRIFALETTEKAGSVAAMCDGNLLAELSLGHAQRSAQSLAPAILALLKQVGWQPGDVQLVAVSQGPGSFTGLRVGVTSAKVFAYAVGAEVLGINTLETIAAAAPDNVPLLSAVIDAQRGDLATRTFARQADGWFQPTEPERLIQAEAWLNELPLDITVSGPALGKWAPRLPAHVKMLAPQCWQPRASAVARLAAHHYSLGRRDDLWKLAPHYSRRSAAEEKWDANKQPVRSA